jgi:hypothetical protein
MSVSLLNRRRRLSRCAHSPKIVMGVHGNGLTHQLWVAPGSCVLEVGEACASAGGEDGCSRLSHLDSQWKILTDLLVRSVYGHRRPFGPKGRCEVIEKLSDAEGEHEGTEGIALRDSLCREEGMGRH